jgi:hypothetical protein
MASTTSELGAEKQSWSLSPASMLAELILGLKRHSGRRPECCPQVEILPAAAAERARPNDVRRRTQWCKCRRRIDPARRVFIDETWSRTSMSALRGWAPRGQRIKADVPHGHWQT